jgi:hypothetical protein
MPDDKSIMKYESVLPENFDGTFKFSNWSDEDFVGKWNSKEYRFPAGTTVPMVMPEHSPLEIQHIRKKFAKDLAEREFFKTKRYETFRMREGLKDDMGMIQPRGQGMSHAGQYTIEDLTPFILKGLEPLPNGTLTSAPIAKVPLEDIIHRDDEGNLVTEAIDKKTSLRDRALKG